MDVLKNFIELKSFHSDQLWMDLNASFQTQPAMLVIYQEPLTGEGRNLKVNAIWTLNSWKAKLAKAKWLRFCKLSCLDVTHIFQ